MNEEEKQILLNKKWELCSKRSLAIQDCDYDKSNSLLKEIQDINQKVYYTTL